MVDALGSKGSGLHEMANLGLNAPCGFTVSTAACAEYQVGGIEFVRRTLWPEVSDGVSFIEREAKKTMFREGNSLTGTPLLLSVRSGDRQGEGTARCQVRFRTRRCDAQVSVRRV